MITPLPNPSTRTHLMPPPLSQLTSAYNSKNNKPEQRYLRGIHLPKSLIITGFYFSAAPRYDKSARHTELIIIPHHKLLFCHFCMIILSLCFSLFIYRIIYLATYLYLSFLSFYLSFHQYIYIFTMFLQHIYLCIKREFSK